MAGSLRAGHRERGALERPRRSAHAQLVIRKGFHKDVDSYSAFLEADKKTNTGLASYLKERGITTIFVTGLATDFCVAWSAIDGRQAGLNVYVVEDACRGIDTQGSLAKAWARHGQGRGQEDPIGRHCDLKSGRTRRADGLCDGA